MSDQREAVLEVMGMSTETMRRLIDERDRAIDERDRARALAVKLEEVVAMRTAIVRAVADRDPDERPDQMIALQAWARAQLGEVP